MKFSQPFLLITFSAVQLAACGIIEGDRIHGSDLAAEEPAFADIDPTADLGPAPVAGARRTLQSLEIEKLAKERSITLSAGQNRSVCFERATLVLTESLSRSGPSRFARFAAPNRARPSGNRRFQPKFAACRRIGLSSRWLGSSGLWRGRLIYAGNRSVPIWARVRVTDASTGKPSRILAGFFRAGCGARRHRFVFRY